MGGASPPRLSPPSHRRPRLADLDARLGNFDAVEDTLRRAIDLDRYAEEPYRRLMILQAHTGSSSAVVDIWRLLNDRLGEIEVDAEPATERLYHSLTNPPESPRRARAGRGCLHNSKRLRSPRHGQQPNRPVLVWVPKRCVVPSAGVSRRSWYGQSRGVPTGGNPMRDLHVTSGTTQRSAVQDKGGHYEQSEGETNAVTVSAPGHRISPATRRVTATTILSGKRHLPRSQPAATP